MFITAIGLTQKLSQTLIPPCRASRYNGGNPRNALASLRPLRFVIRDWCVSPERFSAYLNHIIFITQRRRVAERKMSVV
jgi:hypothetical protein